MDLRRVIADALPKLVSLTLSDPTSGDVSRIVVRPVLVKGERRFQFESRRGTKALHRNVPEADALREIEAALGVFRQAAFATEDADIHVAGRKIVTKPASRPAASLDHDRQKEYILRDAPFLARLGVTGRDGKVLAAKQAKFRQMNRYLEFVDDIVGELPKAPRVVDFGCGKSYLTFALHHFLRRLRGLEAEIVGLDLKRDVVDDCARIAKDLGLEALRFEAGDIAGFRAEGRVDLVVSLHACDTATDDAIAKATEWGATVILAAPCCQHELFDRIGSESQAPLLRHGILRERAASLVTDAIRAARLELAGYAVQVVEFVETEHTPKNVMIRAVKRAGSVDGKRKKELAAFLRAWGLAF